MIPRDTTTGLQSGPAMYGSVEVLVGWLATHADGTHARLGPDRTRAELYAASHHATVEPMYVLRDAPPTRQDGAGGEIDGSVVPW